MATKRQRATTDWILEQVGTVNPYNRQGSNLKSEFYIYNMGFLASYLASLMEEDPWMAKRFEKHIKSQKNS